MMYPLNPSEEQKKYLKKLKQNAMLIQFFRFFLFFAFLFLWEICARTGTIDSFIFSSPSQIAEKMAELFHNGTLLRHISVTLTETLISFLLVTLLGIVCAVLLWAFPRLSALLEPYLVVLNSLRNPLARFSLAGLGKEMKPSFLPDFPSPSSAPS